MKEENAAAMTEHMNGGPVGSWAERRRKKRRRRRRRRKRRRALTASSM
jgi:hypothetical protein